jgi:hypothetical protein
MRRRAWEEKQRVERRHGEKSEKKEGENALMRRGHGEKEKRRVYKVHLLHMYICIMYIVLCTMQTYTVRLQYIKSLQMKPQQN